MSNGERGNDGENGGGTSVALRDRTKNLVSTLEGRREAFTRALANRVDPDRFIQIVATAYMDQSRLQDCTSLSIYKAAIESAQVGLKPDGEEAAIVPYRNGDTGEYEAQFQPMYIGLGRLMLRAGAKKVESRVVREGDEFEYCYGLSPDLRHVPGRSGERGSVTHAYAVIWLPNGETQFEVMDREELDKIKAFATKRGMTPAWSQWEDQMHRKAPLRRLRKFVELDAAASAAFRKDALLEGGDPVPLGELDPRYEVRSLSERAAGHADRQTRDLSRRIAEAEVRRAAGGEPEEVEGEGEIEMTSDPSGDPDESEAEAGAGEGAEDSGEPEESLDADPGPPLDLDAEIPRGKHEGETWRWLVENDREYAESLISHGWILGPRALGQLRDALGASASSSGEAEDVPTLEEAYRRARRRASALAEHGALEWEKSEEIDLLRADGDRDALLEVAEELEEQIQDLGITGAEAEPAEDPDLFDDGDGEER